MTLAQGEAFRAIKAASSKATVGSAYSAAPGYPKTDSEADKAATARYHAMNNVFFLNAALKGEYPNAFVGEPPYELMGVRPGDEKIMKVPLDWVGFHYYTRRMVSDTGGTHARTQQEYGTERVVGYRGSEWRRSLYAVSRGDADGRSTHACGAGGVAAGDVRPGDADFAGVRFSAD